MSRFLRKGEKIHTKLLYRFAWLHFSWGGVARHVGSCLASLTDPDDLSIRISLAMSELAGGTEQGPATWPRKQSHFLFQKSR